MIHPDPTREVMEADSTLYLERFAVRKILIGQPDDHLHITEGILADVDALPIFTKADLALAASAPGEPEVWQREHPVNGWIECCPEYVEHYKTSGQKVRPLYTSAPPAAGWDEANPLLVITYTNYKGETSVRRIAPKSIRFGSTQWHPEPQWLLLAYDTDKQADREFALKDFGSRSDAGGEVRPVEMRLGGTYCEACGEDTGTPPGLARYCCEHCEPKTALSNPSDTGNASAEARLRVCSLITDLQAELEITEGSADLTKWKIEVPVPDLQSLLAAVGDEAKKSGATLTFVRRLVDDPNSASGKSLQDVEVRPSDPTADRREIVARIINPLAFDPEPDPDESEFFRKAARVLALEKADAILAALGGR